VKHWYITMLQLLRHLWSKKLSNNPAKHHRKLHWMIWKSTIYNIFKSVTNALGAWELFSDIPVTLRTQSDILRFNSKEVLVLVLTTKPVFSVWYNYCLNFKPIIIIIFGVWAYAYTQVKSSLRRSKRALTIHTHKSPQALEMSCYLFGTRLYKIIQLFFIFCAESSS